MESTSIEPPFATGPVYGAQEAKFEHENFFKEERSDLERFLMQETENFNANDSHEKIKSVSPRLVSYSAPDGSRLTLSGCFRAVLLMFTVVLPNFIAGWTLICGLFITRITERLTIHKIDDELDTGEIVCQSTWHQNKG